MFTSYRKCLKLFCYKNFLLFYWLAYIPQSVINSKLNSMIKSATWRVYAQDRIYHRTNLDHLGLERQSPRLLSDTVQSQFSPRLQSVPTVSETVALHFLWGNSLGVVYTEQITFKYLQILSILFKKGHIKLYIWWSLISSPPNLGLLIQ